MGLAAAVLMQDATTAVKRSAAGPRCSEGGMAEALVRAGASLFSLPHTPVDPWPVTRPGEVVINRSSLM